MANKSTALSKRARNSRLTSTALVLHANTPPGRAALTAVRRRGVQSIAVNRDTGEYHESRPGYFTLDTCDLNTIESFARELDKKRINVNVLITCPGTVVADAAHEFSQPFEETSPESWDSIMARDLRSAMLFCRVFGKTMRARRAGRIIQLVSNVAVDPHDPRHFSNASVGGVGLFPSAAHSCAMAGKLALSRFLAANFQSCGVLVNNLVYGLLEEAEPSGLKRAYTTRVPLARLMTERDLSDALDLLLDPATNYITGQSITVDGGVAIW